MPSSPNYWGGFSNRKSPWSSNEERLVDEALEAHTTPGEILADLPPPLPQVEVWRPRMGYGDRTERVPTIETCLGVTRYIPDHRLNFSGSAGSFTGSARPATSVQIPGSSNPF